MVAWGVWLATAQVCGVSGVQVLNFPLCCPVQITQKRSASAIKTYKSELAKLRQRCGKLAASVANAEVSGCGSLGR